MSGSIVLKTRSSVANDLEVHLRELRLAIGAEVLVAETLDDLEIAIEPEIIRICLKICGDCGKA